MGCVKKSEFELMIKMGKLVWKFENLFFRDVIPEKIVKQITFPKIPEITAQNKSYPGKNSLHSVQ
jgi:hypothetical protein